MSANEDFADFFALCQIYEETIKFEEYIPSDALLGSLSLAPYGASIFKRMKETKKDLEDTQIMTALVLEMYWGDLFFSPTSANIGILEDEVSRALQSGSIRLPWVYSGVLYRKVDTSITYTAKKLSNSETQSLLSETPQGVFQYRAYVTGPFGLLKSKQMRNHKSQREIPLSHCTDPSCSAIHTALLTDNHGGTEVSRHLQDVVSVGQQSSAELQKRYNRIDGEIDYYDDRNAAGIISFLGDSFDVSELRLIVSDLLPQPKGLRSYLSKVKGAPSLSGSAAQIAARLNEAECLQLILLEPDRMVAASIDRLIAGSAIKIPASKTRCAKLAINSRRGWHNLKIEASCYGIRLMSLRPGLPLARLKRLIRAVYGADQNSSTLNWMLRYTAGDTIEQKLNNYLSNHTPEEALAEHVFSSPEALEKAFDDIRLGHFELPTTAEKEKHLVKRMMWKLGFDVPAHPLHYEKLSANIENLRQANSKHLSRQGDSLHRIRGEAVNLFVELEGFLANALAFLCWMLTSDHYTQTRFSYDLGLSSREMAEKLNAYQETVGASLPIAYDIQGQDTLFPLVSGFRLLADYCRHLQAESDIYERPAQECPGYVGRDRVQIFPFNHTKFFLDLNEKTRTSILSELVDVTVKLENLKTANIRNRIEHNRDDFPDREEIESFLDGLTIVTERMQSMGLAPLSYVHAGMEADQWGRGSVYFKNHRGEKICLPVRAELDSCNLPYGGYIIIVPSVVVGDSQELARFLIQEPSKYRDLWRGYPIRRVVREND